MKVIVIAPANITDAIFATPVIRAVKVQPENSVVHFAVASDYFPCFEENPYIDQLIDKNMGAWKLLQMVRSGSYDVVCNLDDDALMKFLLRSSGVRSYNVRSLRTEHWLMSRLKIDKLPNQHISDRMVETLNALGVKGDELGLDYFIPHKDEVPVEWLPSYFHEGYVIVSLHADFYTRRLPLKRIIDLCDKINKPIILIGKEEDKDLGQEVEEFFKQSEISQEWEAGLKELNKRAIVYNGCGRFNINQVASLIKQSRCVFLFDSEIVPIASAFKKTVYLLLGNTILSFGRYPYRTRFVVLENNKLGCRPCTGKGYPRCPLGHFKCMREVVFDFYIP